MTIAQGQVTLAAQAQAAVRTETTSTLRVQVQTRQASASSQDTYAGAKQDSTDASTGLDPKLALLKQLIEALTKHRIHVMTAGDLKGKTTAVATPTTTSPAPPATTWSATATTATTTTDEQALALQAQGAVTTEDGRAIDFSLQLDVARQFVSHDTTTVTAGNAPVDPLVLNLDGFTGTLAGGSFSFDLNNDGTAETLQAPGAGHPFLTLDRNGDGQINNGSELLGPTTGSGFAELGRLDSDGNGWIDENDPAFGKLSLWTPGSDPVGLQSAGVGAIALNSIAAPFALKDAANTLTGISQRAGIYLHEDGTPGTLQQIDLVG